MKLLTLLILACCLTLGCASGTLPTPDASIQPIKVEPPASLTQPPAPLPAARSGKVPDLEANHQAGAKAYHQLATQMCNLLAFLEINHDECKPWRVAPDLR
jgi:hypothetical protein